MGVIVIVGGMLKVQFLQSLLKNEGKWQENSEKEEQGKI